MNSTIVQLRRSTLERRPAVAERTRIDISRVHKGLAVHSADGIKLGTVTEVWIGIDPSESTAPYDEELCSRVEVHHSHDAPWYIPADVMAAVDGDVVTLHVDAATARTLPWHHRPAWLPAANTGGLMVGMAPRTGSLAPPVKALFPRPLRRK
jgi:hypothetical protein